VTADSSAVADEGVSGSRVDIAEGPAAITTQLDYIRKAVHAVPSSSTRRQRDEPSATRRGGQATGGITPAMRCLSHKAQVLADWTLAVFFRRETAQLTFLEHPPTPSAAR
jgi:hypothetical protein